MNYDFLKNVIPVGMKNAIHQNELAGRLGVTPAGAKSLVRNARQAGLQIISGTAGYWFAEDEAEKRKFVNSMQKQAISRLKSATPIRKTISPIKGQISLYDSVSDLLENISDNQ